MPEERTIQMEIDLSVSIRFTVSDSIIETAEGISLVRSAVQRPMSDDRKYIKQETSFIISGS